MVAAWQRQLDTGSITRVCGLTGLLTRPGPGREELAGRIERMTAPIAHRGPDDSGVWVDAAAGVALGFRRLAILDLSEQGHQPMRSPSGRFTLVFNGEVFNHHELRRELQGGGLRFRGHSDTEVILAAFERWGVEAAVPRFVGMFAIAVWDGEQQALWLIRDRLGIKPMFVYAEPGLVTFGSELKALVAGPSFDRSLDLTAITQYLRYLYVPAPRTVYRRAIKLLPGHLLRITDPAVPLPDPVPFWSAEMAAAQGAIDPFGGSEEEAIRELDRLLVECVGMRMEADVPLGALLSGGIDSSTVVAVMQSLSTRPVKTFTIGFDEAEHNEAAHARRIAQHLGTDHTELLLTGAEALDLVPRLPDMFDEPLADPSQIPTFLVCQLARREVTVALTGDGGDECFAGYNRYIRGERLITRARRFPASVRRLSAIGIASMAPETWDRLHQAVSPVLPSSARVRLPGAKLHKIGDLIGAESVPLMYRSLLSAWQDPGLLVAGGRDGEDRVLQVLGGGEPRALLDRMMLADQLTYLPDDLLAKVDRASMATSLEARVPLLDHRLVEFSWRLPHALKIRKRQGKWILRQVLYRRVPRNLVDREKVGFTVPIAHWLRGPLRAWAEDLLAPDALRRDGLLEAVPIRRAWERFLSGKGHDATGLWTVLMLRAWSGRWLA